MQYPILPSGLATRVEAVRVAFETSGMKLKDWLDAKECPYENEMKTVLRKWLAQPDVVAAAVKDAAVVAEKVESLTQVAPLDKFDVVLAQVEEAVDTLKALQDHITSGVQDSADPKDQINLTKAYVSIVDRWIGLQEEIFNAKEISHFQALVMTILDEITTVDQRDEFKKRLRGLQSVKVLTAGETK